MNHNRGLVPGFGIGDGTIPGFMELTAKDVTEIYRIAAHATI